MGLLVSYRPLAHPCKEPCLSRLLHRATTVAKKSAARYAKKKLSQAPAPAVRYSRIAAPGTHARLFHRKGCGLTVTAAGAPVHET